jgi:hypothetical protein
VDDERLYLGNVVVDAFSAWRAADLKKSCSVLAAVRPFWQFPSIMEHIVGEPVDRRGDDYS